jgi:hypothetical protein
MAVHLVPDRAIELVFVDLLRALRVAYLLGIGKRRERPQDQPLADHLWTICSPA